VLHRALKAENCDERKGRAAALMAADGRGDPRGPSGEGGLPSPSSTPKRSARFDGSSPRRWC